MKKLLVIDIGNTNITLGLFRGSRLLKKAKMPTHVYSGYAGTVKRLVGSAHPAREKARAVISSVVPLALSRFVMELNRIGSFDVRIVGRDVKVPVRNLYRIKSEVGQDRLVNAHAAKELYGAPAVIIDFGTAVTFDVLSRRGDYLGGLILPGIEMSLKSLHEKTALLPRVELKPVSGIVARDTVSSMRGGILFGLGAMCDGLAAKFRKILGSKTKVIATGGNAHLMSRYAKSIQIVDSDLTLKGLRLLA